MQHRSKRQEGLVTGFEIVLGNAGEYLRKQNFVRGWTLSRSKGNLMIRPLNFCVGGRRNTARLELSLVMKQSSLLLAEKDVWSFLNCIVSLFIYICIF